MNISKERIRTFSRIMKVFFNVFFWISVAVGAICSILFLLTFVVDKSLFYNHLDEWEKLSVTMGMVKYDVIPDMNGGVDMKPLLQNILPTFMVNFSIAAIVSYNLKSILKTVAEDNPFERNNAKRFFVIGIVIIISSVVTDITKGIMAHNLIDWLNIENGNVTYTVNGGMLLAGLLILVLAGIFRYGTYLQEEYDATL